MVGLEMKRLRKALVLLDEYYPKGITGTQQ